MIVDKNNKFNYKKFKSTAKNIFFL